MNRYFKDAQHHLKRAAETAKAGVAEELAPLRERFQSLVGGEDEPEPGRIEEIRSELATLQDRAEGEAREAIVDARERLGSYRKQRNE